MFSMQRGSKAANQNDGTFAVPSQPTSVNSAPCSSQEMSAIVGFPVYPRLHVGRGSHTILPVAKLVHFKKPGPPKKTASNAGKNEARQVFRYDESCPEGKLVCLICEQKYPDDLEKAFVAWETAKETHSSTWESILRFLIRKRTLIENSARYR